MKQMPGVCPGGMLAVGIDTHSELKHRDTFACLRDVWCQKIEDPPKDRPVMGIYFFRNLKQHD